MKMRREHFEHLRAALAPLDTPDLRAHYKGNGMSDMRYRWDLVWRAGLSNWICDNLYRSQDGYDYLNDEHINTALRRIVPSL